MEYISVSDMINLRPFADTSSANVKYSLRNSEILLQPIKMYLSNKQITFSEFLAQFLKSTSRCEHFEKKDRHSLYISQTFPRYVILYFSFIRG